MPGPAPRGHCRGGGGQAVAACPDGAATPTCWPSGTFECGSARGNPQDGAGVSVPLPAASGAVASRPAPSGAVVSRPTASSANAVVGSPKAVVGSPVAPTTIAGAALPAAATLAARALTALGSGTACTPAALCRASPRLVGARTAGGSPRSTCGRERAAPHLAQAASVGRLATVPHRGQKITLLDYPDAATLPSRIPRQAPTVRSASLMSPPTRCPREARRTRSSVRSTRPRSRSPPCRHPGAPARSTER